MGTGQGIELTILLLQSFRQTSEVYSKNCSQPACQQLLLTSYVCTAWNDLYNKPGQEYAKGKGSLTTETIKEKF